ncbi:hypothetical protein BKA83DRAFT_4044319 [Pisolithus microcarpus]|nr:hypothetical protein BKA83DRAFT_4044319 [Pisolithus microcarpus]
MGTLTVKLGSALIVPKSITVTEVSQLCATKCTDCILIVDDEERLQNIYSQRYGPWSVSSISRFPELTWCRLQQMGWIYTVHPPVK